MKMKMKMKMETTNYFWQNTLPKVNKVLAKMGFAVMPASNGIMCIIDAEAEKENCPEIWARFHCSQLADVSTVVYMAKLTIARFY